MVRRRRSGSTFWLLLLVLVLGGGWAAHHYWQWPHLRLLDRDSGTEQASVPDAEQPGALRPAEDSTVERPAVEPEADAAAPSAEAETALDDPAASADEDLAAELAPEELEPADDIAGTGPTPAAKSAQAPQSAEAESAAGQADPEPIEAESAALDADPAPAAQDKDTVQAEAVAGAPAQEPAAQEPTVGLTREEEAGDASIAATGDASPDAEGEAETEAGPSFDIVRVGRDGRAVIAGRAAPGAEVEVRSGGQVIDRVHATRRGEWVAIPARPLPAGDQELIAVETQAGAAVESKQMVVVAVPEPTSPTPAAGPSAGRETAAPDQPVAVLLPRDGRGSGRVLQAPGRLSAEGTLALMTVSYDESGEVLLSGEAPPGVPVRIYVDNRPAALVVGDAKGGWTSGLDEALEPGTYTLRLDQLDADGQTVARIETPFTRVSEPPVEGNLQVDYVVVQPGNSLWRIARRLSGKGMDYVHIYGSNQSQIRDPDLIYPGQVFEIPAAFGSAG